MERRRWQLASCRGAMSTRIIHCLPTFIHRVTRNAFHRGPILTRILLAAVGGDWMQGWSADGRRGEKDFYSAPRRVTRDVQESQVKTRRSQPVRRCGRSQSRSTCRRTMIYPSSSRRCSGNRLTLACSNEPMSAMLSMPAGLNPLDPLLPAPPLRHHCAKAHGGRHG